MPRVAITSYMRRSIIGIFVLKALLIRTVSPTSETIVGVACAGALRAAGGRAACLDTFATFAGRLGPPFDMPTRDLGRSRTPVFV